MDSISLKWPCRNLINNLNIRDQIPLKILQIDISIVFGLYSVSKAIEMNSFKANQTDFQNGYKRAISVISLIYIAEDLFVHFIQNNVANWFFKIVQLTQCITHMYWIDHLNISSVKHTTSINTHHLFIAPGYHI